MFIFTFAYYYYFVHTKIEFRIFNSIPLFYHLNQTLIKSIFSLDDIMHSFDLFDLFYIFLYKIK